MAKIYGGRWQLTSSPPLGTGGQGTVFRVIDIRGEYPGEYALKRVLNPERHDRFEREIEAIKTIQHPNVVRLIDHSALTAASGEVEKQFLVTPIAEGGEAEALVFLASFALLAIMHTDAAGAALQMIDDARGGRALPLQMMSIHVPASRWMAWWGLSLTAT